jgi:hypothetical protein
MPFKVKCASWSLHAAWNIQSDSSNIVTSKISKDVRDVLLAKCNRSLTDFKSSPKFCEECVEKVLMETPNLTTKEPEDEIKKEDRGSKRKLEQENHLSPETIIEALHCLLQKERAEIAFELGRMESVSVRRDHAQLAEEKDLHHIDLKEYISKRNPVVVSFMNGLSGNAHTIQSQTVPESDKCLYSLCKTVESVMHYANPNLLLPLHLRESILLYTTVGSKLALQIVSLGSGHASYKCVRNYVENVSTTVERCVSSDILAVFDNNQIFQRRWQVKLDNKFVCNVVTILVFFQLHEGGSMVEANAHFCSTEWSFKRLTELQAEKLKTIDKHPTYKLVHNKHLSSFISASLTNVVNKQQWDADEQHWIDDIDKKIQIQRDKDMFKKCDSCGTEKINKNKRKCVCGHSLKKSSGEEIQQTMRHSACKPTLKSEEVISSSYNEETQMHVISSKKIDSTRSTCKSTKEKVQVNVQLPVHVNPCSYEAVKKVLLDIGKKADVNQYNPAGSRKWLPVACDGLPFGLCSKVVACTYRCTICDPNRAEFDNLVHGFKEYEQHIHEQHAKHQFSSQELKMHLEFKWVILIPGPGHIEMNLVKSFVELCWDIFYQEMVKIFGFTTDNALIGAKRVSDHHKAWTLLTIARQALTAELILPYVRAMLGQDVEMSAAHFFKYVMDTCNPNYFFIADITFEILDGIFLYRIGVREGNKDKMEAGRAKSAKLWFGRSHPLYRELDTLDMINREKMPPELYEFVSHCLSLTTGDSANSGEGPDFRLEEVNKQIQHLLPNVPKSKDWDQACSNHDNLVALRDCMFSSAGAQDPKEKVCGKKIELSSEIEAFRMLLRSSEYLLHPHKECKHTSIKGNIELDQELHLFCSKARELRSNYVHKFISHESTRYESKFARFNFKAAPIFVTNDERDNYFAIDNQTIEEIKQRIQKEIHKVEDMSMQNVFEAIFQEDILKMKGSKAKKADFIALYDEITEYLEKEHINNCMESPSEDQINL